MPSSLPAADSGEIGAPTPDGDGLLPKHFQVLVSKHVDADIEALEQAGWQAHGRKDLPHLPLRLPLDWHANPFGDRNWMYQLHAWRMLDPHLNRLAAMPATGRPDATGSFARILDVVADWHRANVVETPGPFTWHDMATGMRASKLALLVLLARRHGVSLPAHVALLIEMHIAELSDPARLSAGNHGLFQLQGLMALAHACPDIPRAREAAPYAEARMSALIDAQFGAAGVHTENSPGYHFFALRTLGDLLDAPWWQIAALAPAREKLVAARRAGFWLADPAGHCLPVGDSTAGVQQRHFRGLAEWPHQRQGKVLGAVVDGYGVVRTAPDLPPARSSMLFMTASFRSAYHKHSDCLSCVWQEGGANLLIDSGKYSYQSDAMRDYFISTRAHNTVEIGGKDSSRRQVHVYGSGMRQVAPLGQSWLVAAEADRRHAGVLHRRSLLFRPGRFLLAVDHITAADGLSALRLPGARAFTSWWHFDPALALRRDAAGNVWRVTGLPRGRSLRVSHVTAAEGLRSARHQGEMAPRTQGWVSEAYLEYRPAPVLGFSVRTGADYFAATLLEIVARGAEPELALEWRPADATIALGSAALPGQAMRSFRFGEFALEAGDALL